MSEDENDLESYTLCLAQLAICYIFIGDIEAFIEHSREFSEKNRSLGHIEMDLEIQILSGYVYNYKGDLDEAKKFYKDSLQNSLLCENERYKHVSLCNIGIIEANKNIDEFWNNLGDPELSKNIDFDNYENNELLEQYQEQELDEQKDQHQLENMQKDDEQDNKHYQEQQLQEHEQENDYSENVDNEGQENENKEMDSNLEGEGDEHKISNEEVEVNEGEYPHEKRGYSAGDKVGYSEPNNFEGQGMGDEEQELDGDNEEQYMEGDPNEQYQNDEQEQGDEQYQGDADEQDEEN